MNIVFHVGYFAIPWSSSTKIPGGTEQCVSNLSIQLSKAGHNVFVFGNVLEDNSDSVQYAPFERRDLLPESIDILIGVGYLHYVKLFEGHSVKHRIFWLHNEEPYVWINGKRMSDQDIQEAFDLSDAIVCLTKWHKKDFLSRYSVDPEKVSVIGNGIDHKRIFAPSSKIKDSYVYTSHAERGLSTVLDDFESGKITGTLHIATPAYGIDYFKSKYADRISRNKSIKYYGALDTDRLYELLSQMEYWYYPTTYNETYCITALEMLAHRVRPIVNPIAGLAETLSEFAYDISCWKCVNEYVMTRWWSNVVNEWKSLFYQLQSKAMGNIIEIPGGVFDDIKVVKTPSAEDHKVLDVEHTYIISLNPDSQIRFELLERFIGSGVKSGGMTIFDATNGYTGSLMPPGINVWKDWKIASDNSWWNRDVLPGEIGCAVSHWRVWKDAYENGYKRILILEEDFTVLRQFNSIEVDAIQEPWTIMYLGHSFVRQPKRRISDSVVEPDYTYTTHAYMLTNEGCRLLLEQNFDKSIIPLDEFLSATFCDHPRKDLSWIWKDSKALALTPAVFGQSSTKETSTTENQPKSIEMNLSNYSYEEFVQRFVTYSARTKEWELIVDEPINDVFVFPLFTEEFCSLLIQQAEDSGRWTRNRHYFYPTCDMLINELGLQEHYQRILEEYVYPVAIKKWALEGQEWTNMSSENFIIKYDEAIQGHLALHHDSASISMVLALNDDYEGGGTYFWRQKELHKGKAGYISIHPSVITHRHGARAVTKGKRFVLVSFCNRIK